MFQPPSLKLFRLTLLFGFILWVTTWVIQYYGYDVMTQLEDDALMLNYLEAKLSPETIDNLDLLQTLSFGIGLIAMYFLKEWGRNLIVASMILYAVMTPFMGLAVNTAVGDMLQYVTDILIYIPLILSFFKPCSDYFKTSKN